MFFLIGVFLLALGAIPLALTIRKQEKISHADFLRRLRRSMIYLLTDLILLVIAALFSSSTGSISGSATLVSPNVSSMCS